MASKRRIRRKQCEGKVRFVADYRASEAAEYRGMGYYLCSFCGAYHIGHAPEIERNAQKPSWLARRGDIAK